MSYIWDIKQIDMYVLKTPYETYNVSLETGKYTDGRTFLQLIDTEDGAPIMMATVNIPAVVLEKDEIIIKNYSENEGVLEFLIENGIVSKPLRWAASGWVTCPIVKLWNNKRTPSMGSVGIGNLSDCEASEITVK